MSAMKYSTEVVEELADWFGALSAWWTYEDKDGIGHDWSYTGDCLSNEALELMGCVNGFMWTERGTFESCVYAAECEALLRSGWQPE